MWSMKLYAGWNNIAYGGETMPVEQVVFTPPEALVSIWWFNNVTKDWDGYAVGVPAWANDLKEMVKGNVYQVHVSQDATIGGTPQPGGRSWVAPVVVGTTVLVGLAVVAANVATIRGTKTPKR